MLLIQNDQHGLKPSQNLVLTPFLCEFNHAAGEIPPEFLQLRLETFEKREGISGGAGESCKNGVVMHFAYFSGSVLHDHFPGGYLTIASDRDLTFVVQSQYCCSLHKHYYNEKRASVKPCRRARRGGGMLGTSLDHLDNT